MGARSIDSDIKRNMVCLQSVIRFDHARGDNAERRRRRAAAGGGSTSPLTTKGDLWGFSTVNARLPVGANGQVPVADSTQPLGIRWATAGAAAAGGSDTQMQYNSSGILAGDTGSTTDGAGNVTHSTVTTVGGTNPSQIKMTYNGGHAPTGTAGSAVMAPDTVGNMTINPNNTAFTLSPSLAAGFVTGALRAAYQFRWYLDDC